MLKFGYNFLEIGGLWSTYFDAFEKCFKTPKFCGIKLKTKKLFSDKFKNLVSSFSQLVNFGLHIFEVLGSTQKNYKIPKTEAKVLRRKSCGWLKFVSDSDFLKINKLWSAYIDVFGNPWKGLQATKIF